MLEAVSLIKLLVEDMQHRRALALQEHWEMISMGSKERVEIQPSHNKQAEEDSDDIFARDGYVPPSLSSCACA